jgi:hypothetical protein
MQKMDEELRTYTCCLFGKAFSGYGNNPWPGVAMTVTSVLSSRSASSSCMKHRQTDLKKLSDSVCSKARERCTKVGTASEHDAHGKRVL